MAFFVNSCQDFDGGRGPTSLCELRRGTQFCCPAEAGTKLVEVAGVEPDRQVHLLAPEIHFSTSTSTLQNSKGALKCSKMQENEQQSANLLQIRA